MAPLYEPPIPFPAPFGLAFLTIETPETVSVAETRALMFPSTLFLDGVIELDGMLIEV